MNFDPISTLPATPMENRVQELLVTKLERLKALLGEEQDEEKALQEAAELQGKLKDNLDRWKDNFDKSSCIKMMKHIRSLQHYHLGILSQRLSRAFSRNLVTGPTTTTGGVGTNPTNRRIPSHDAKRTPKNDLQLTAVGRVVAFTSEHWPLQQHHRIGTMPLRSLGLGFGFGHRNFLSFRRRLHTPLVQNSSKKILPSIWTCDSEADQTNADQATLAHNFLLHLLLPKEPPGPGEVSGTQRTPNVIEPPAIKTHPYCSQQCLLVLKDGGPLDPLCPNHKDNYKDIRKVANFLADIQKQLAIDHGSDAECCPLCKAGSCGAPFKVRLSSHGYSMVAKGGPYENRHKLKHEKRIYNTLQDVQGKSIPAIHSKGVLHGDAELRSILWNPTSQCAMILAFELATVHRALSYVSVKPARTKRNLMESWGLVLTMSWSQHIGTMIEGNTA
ncbi:hypothetical protein ACJ72_04669 [Emergomyces africanus]|uniref:Uncharacterized protein n=1 Tax=Emergomyces africanus TaxID=1955775 RepID=A0A1B7NW37_9EURO|nr:hypothetical protein ACJ72_04669 [Emergomyces africanus]